MLEVILDTETTGLSTSEKHRIVEIGCIELNNQIPTNRIFHEYLNPQRKVSEDAYKIHGYSDKFLSDKRTFSEIAKDFLNFIKNKKIIIHNAAFDLSFLNYELKRTNQGEIDKNNINILKKKYQNDTNVTVLESEVSKISQKFNTICHFNVLEHVKEDKEEIINCLNKINKDGYLIILAPAHNELYGNLDREVGHYRRYKKSFFKDLNLSDGKIVELKYMDCMGYILYYMNKLIYKNETYPSSLKIFIWDKIFTPITILLDRRSRNSF